MTRKKSPTYFAPVFDDWKAVAALRIWEIAAMMRGFDPRVMTDVVDAQGDGLDLSFEIRMLTSAVTTGVLPTIPPNTTTSDQTEVAAVSLIPWLRDNGFGTLANGLSNSSKSGRAKRWTPEFTAEVKNYREKHNTKATAEFFGVSTARIREKLPGRSPAPEAYSAFSRTKKTP